MMCSRPKEVKLFAILIIFRKNKKADKIFFSKIFRGCKKHNILLTFSAGLATFYKEEKSARKRADKIKSHGQKQ